MKASEDSGDRVKLTVFIKSSSLSQGDKVFWADLLRYISSDIASDILGFLTKFPNKANWATDIVKRRVEVLRKGFGKAWELVRALDEGKYLESFPEGEVKIKTGEAKENE